MSTYWLRLYTGILDDPKVQRLAPEHFKGWVNLLCLAKEHDGLLPGIEDIAFRLRIEDDQALALIEVLKARGLLDDCGDGQITPHNWSGRQYETGAAPSASPSEKGTVGNHVRWHVSRGIVADDCPYCRPDIAGDRSESLATSQGIASESDPNRSDIAPIRQRFASDSDPNPNRIASESRRSRSRAEAEAESEAEAEAEQSRGDAMPALPAAADGSDFNEAHSSIFAFYTVEDFVRETKPHATNPGGLARRLWRSGEEDRQIGQWKLARDSLAKEPVYPKWVFDPKEPGGVEDKKRFHRELVEQQRAIEAESKLEAVTDAA